MLWAANLANGKVGYAVWDLFSPEDLPKLRDFLRKIVCFVGLGDPVHSQTIYLTPTLLQHFFDTFGIRPIRIYQYPNEPYLSLRDMPTKCVVKSLEYI